MQELSPLLKDDADATPDAGEKTDSPAPVADNATTDRRGTQRALQLPDALDRKQLVTSSSSSSRDRHRPSRFWSPACERKRRRESARPTAASSMYDLRVDVLDDFRSKTSPSCLLFSTVLM